jgi:hypothetical protein
VGSGRCLDRNPASEDLSRLGPVEPGLQFNDTTLWSQLYSLNGHPLREGALLPVGSTLAGLVWPNYAPIDADQLQQCIAHAENHGSPSAEWLLIRDANSMCAGHDFRRAVLAAGLASTASTKCSTGWNADRSTDASSSIIGNADVGEPGAGTAPFRSADGLGS